MTGENRCCDKVCCEDNNVTRYRVCCDENGCCRYPCSCRNPYWPEFAHPRWLSCEDLYNGSNESCCEENTSNCCE